MALAVRPDLLAVAADPHVAPHRGAVARLVVVGPLAVLCEAGLQPQPGALLDGRGDDREQPPERAVGALRERLGAGRAIGREADCEPGAAGGRVELRRRG